MDGTEQRTADVILLALFTSLVVVSALLLHWRRKCFPISQFPVTLRRFWVLMPTVGVTSILLRLLQPVNNELVWLTLTMEQFYCIVATLSTSLFVAAVCSRVELQKLVMEFPTLSEEKAAAAAVRIRKLRTISSDAFAARMMGVASAIALAIFLVWGAVDTTHSFSTRGAYRLQVVHIVPTLLAACVTNAVIMRFLPYLRREPDMHHIVVLLGMASVFSPVLVAITLYLVLSPLNYYPAIPELIMVPFSALIMMLAALQTAGFDPTRGRWCLHWRAARVAAAYDWDDRPREEALAEIVGDNDGNYLFCRLLQQELAISKLLFVEAVRSLRGDAGRAAQQSLRELYLREDAVLHVDLQSCVEGNNADLIKAISDGDAIDLLRRTAKEVWAQLAEEYLPAFLDCEYFRLWLRSPAYMAKFVFAREELGSVVDDEEETPWGEF
eukprot:PLAT3302.22.p3 GENE.PLAT3302.22~~PLAT3302.22.p3  ORF type:complete len:440 (-),score=169.22 PLAT3302.22:1529-2848(-)